MSAHVCVQTWHMVLVVLFVQLSSTTNLMQTATFVMTPPDTWTCTLDLPILLCLYNERRYIIHHERFEKPVRLADTPKRPQERCRLVAHWASRCSCDSRCESADRGFNFLLLTHLCTALLSRVSQPNIQGICRHKSIRRWSTLL